MERRISYIFRHTSVFKKTKSKKPVKDKASYCPNIRHKSGFPSCCPDTEESCLVNDIPMTTNDSHTLKEMTVNPDPL